MNEFTRKIYEARFDNDEIKNKEKLWKILVSSFMQKYIDLEDDVLDVGGGYCEFINAVKCHRKYLVDINPEAKTFAADNVRALTCSAQDIEELGDETIDLVFASNFFEHMSSKNEVLNIIREIYRLLKSGGKLLVIQPNIKYAYKEYWDFFDHQIPFTERSFSEALLTNGFKILESYPRFLPFTTKTCLSRFAFLLKIYLKVPILWKVFGKQFFLVARKLT